MVRVCDFFTGVGYLWFLGASLALLMSFGCDFVRVVVVMWFGGCLLVCLCVVLVLPGFLCIYVWLVVLRYVGVYLCGGLVVWVVWVVVCCVDLAGYDFGWLVCCWLVVFD